MTRKSLTIPGDALVLLIIFLPNATNAQPLIGSVRRKPHAIHKNAPKGIAIALMAFAIA